MKVKLLDPRAKAPTVEHPHWDLGYDLYALEKTELIPNLPQPIRTGIAIEFPAYWGGIIKDRSSMASFGITVSGGVIDSGYRGEILVILTSHRLYENFWVIQPGDRVAQLVLHKSLTYEEIEVVGDLNETTRGDKGFGSSGR